MKTESGLTEGPAEPAESAEAVPERRSVRDPAGSLPAAVRRPLLLLCRVMRAVFGVLIRPGVVAVLIWGVAAPLAMAVPSALDLDPFRQTHAFVPIVAGGLVTTAVVCVSLWRYGAVMAGVAAGLFSAWTVLLLRTAWHGTPFPAGGLYGDAGRLAAMATRYTATAASSDGIVEGVPSEYPPLFPWLIGRVAVIQGVPAWQLVAPAEIIAISASVLVGFLLWSRLTSPGAALLICVVNLLIFGKPDKAYEVLALAMLVPLILLTVASPDRGRLHWLPAGLVGALMALTYYAYLVYAALGILFLAWWTWRGESARWAYVWYLGRVVLVMLAASSWYLIPYVQGIRNGGQQVADTFGSNSLSASPLPFLEPTPLGVAQLIGLVGLVWLLKSAWWAPPLLATVVSGYAYYLISFARFVTTGHTGLLHYVFSLISGCLVAAAVFTAVHAGPALASFARTPFPRRGGVAIAAVVLVFVGHSYWKLSMPVTRWTSGPNGVSKPDYAGMGSQNLQAARAHNQPFPDGSRPRSSGDAAPAGDLPWFPVEPVRQAVETVLGRGVRPRTLAYDEELFGFLPWRGYIAVNRGSASTLTLWDDRYAELTRLAGISEPAAFAEFSAHTEFGPIDVFVLRRDNADLVWRPGGTEGELRFQRRQFASASFVVVDDLPARTVVVIRRG